MIFNGTESCIYAVKLVCEENSMPLIENDEGFLFRETQDTMPLRAKDENVVYISSFLGIVFPAAKIAFALVPEKIRDKMSVYKYLFSSPDNVLCRALAYFMQEKNWERYLYRLAAEEKDKMRIMKNVCIEVFGCIDTQDSTKGCVTICRTAAESITKKASQADIFVQYSGDKLMLGVRGLKKNEIESAVRMLYEYGVK